MLLMFNLISRFSYLRVFFYVCALESGGKKRPEAEKGEGGARE